MNSDREMSGTGERHPECGHPMFTCSACNRRFCVEDASGYNDGLCVLCGADEPKDEKPRQRRLVVNLGPLNVVKVRGQVPTGTAEWLRSLSRDQRKVMWVAIGGDPDEWETEHPQTGR